MKGLLLVNLGSPDEPTTPAVRRYLREFLSDPRVIDIGAVGRWLLLHVFILPFRPARSAAAYRKVWRPDGSPLLANSRALAAAVAERLGPDWHVELAMRYGKPAVADGLERLRATGVDDIVVMPLYPQYAASSTGSTLEAVYAQTAARWVVPNLTVVPPFYDDAGYLDAFAAVGKDVLAADRYDFVLFSFHGLPERQVVKTDDSAAHCLKSADCCDRVVAVNRNCYRAQCHATARGLAARLALAEGAWSVSFQSRLGRTPWIRPYTDVVLPELAAQGKKRIAVFCPAFVADCLETLEEIGIRAREQWQGLGGERLTLVPSLNDTPAWSDAVVSLVRRSVGTG
jgi:protoporphyrin/coproporphyrin ferrochelatase